jgi:hypothetical protein
MSEPPRTKAESYGRAAVAGQLRFVDERRTDLDTIAAAGMAAQHEPVGMTIWRGMYANDARSFRAALVLIQGRVRNLARRKRWREPPGVLRHLTADVFGWWVFGICVTCQGRGHPVVDGIDRVLADDDCPACYGTGRVLIEHAVPVELVGRAKDIAQLLAVAERRAEGLVRAKLSGRVERPDDAAAAADESAWRASDAVHSAHAATTFPGENPATTTTGAASSDAPVRPSISARPIAALLRAPTRPQDE